MAKFLTGNALNHELSKLLERAEERIVIISPYIKLHDRYVSILKDKKNNPRLNITIVFGKNEDNISKSMQKDDFIFFKEFPNIQIRYEKRLHAKYYASESVAILTSMNLYSYSQDNNIEAGIMTKATLLGNISNVIIDDNFEHQASEYFYRVIEQSKLLFNKKPVFNKGTLGTGLLKKYLKSDIETDLLSDFFSNRNKYDKNDVNPVKRNNFYKNSTKKAKKHYGYCIRTGKEMPFNIDKPLSYDAYLSWNNYGDSDYPEKYCHYSGEKSFGETSVSKPILNKNWRKAKEEFRL